MDNQEYWRGTLDKKREPRDIDEIMRQRNRSVCMAWNRRFQTQHGAAVTVHTPEVKKANMPTINELRTLRDATMCCLRLRFWKLEIDFLRVWKK